MAKAFTLLPPTVRVRVRLGVRLSLQLCPDKEIFNVGASPVCGPRLAWKSPASLGVLLNNTPVSRDEFPEWRPLCARILCDEVRRIV